MRCPYANCQDEETTEVAQSIWRCSVCNRLSLECEDKNCLYLNRPFNRHCRHCGDDMLTESWRGSAAQQWTAAGKFDRACRPIESGSPVLVVDLSDRPGYVPPQRKVQLKFFEGLLALHYGGVCMALLHPFQSPDTVEADLWNDNEGVVGPPRIRAFPPARMPGDRFIVFSTTRAVYCVDVWMLRDWAFQAKTPRRTLLDLSAEEGVELAATPILLSSHQLGLFLRSQGEYRWGVLDLNAQQDTNSTSDFVEKSVKLPIKGNHCQIEHVSGRVLAFATPTSHWLWKSSDALNSVTAGLKCSLETTGAKEFRLDRHILNDVEFHFGRQQFLCDPSNQEFFNWYYETDGENEDAELKRYRIYFESLETYDPASINTGRNAVPIGPYQNATLEMLFAGRNSLLYEVAGELQSPGGELGPIPELINSMGLTFDDPLLTAVSDHDEIRIRSIYDSRESVIKANQMWSDPVIWSHWLFTCETENERLLIYRRDLGSEPISIN